MKYRIKLLQDWTDPSGNDFEAGTVIEIADKSVVSELVVNGTAEMYKEKAKAADVDDDMKNTISSAVKEAVKPLKEKVDQIEVKNNIDDDPTWGYLGYKKNYTKDDIQYGVGMFAADIAKAASGNRIPERLAKAQEKHASVISKAAGDGMTVGDPSEGGYMLPPEFSMQMLDQQMEVSKIRPRATQLSTSSDILSLPRVKNYDHSSDLIYGGVLAYFKAEEAQLSESKPAEEQISVPLHELTVLAYASHKIVTMSPVTIGSFLVPKMTDGIGWKEDNVFINGTGAGMPLGMLNSPSKVEVSIESGQTLAASAYVTENALKMYERCRIEKNGSVVWLYNKPDLFRWLALCTIDVGTGGAPAGLIQRLPGSPDMNMLGIPLVDTEHCQAAGTVGDIILADMSQYLVVDHRRGPEVASSIHLKFDYGQTAYRIIKYVGGAPAYSSAFTRRYSTNTTAPVVTLGARS